MGLFANGTPFSHDVASETRKHKQRRAPLPNTGSDAGRAQLPKEKKESAKQIVFSGIKVGFPNKGECYFFVRHSAEESHSGTYFTVTL